MTTLAAPASVSTAATAVDAVRRPRAFRPDIEGLRAIAVLLVVVYHAGWKGLPGGFVGVDVFFVLSGFLITGHLAKEVRTTSTLSVAGFYARRARRILPGATAVVIATVILARLAFDPVRAAGVATDGRWAAGFLANVHFLEVGTNYLNAGAPPSPLQHFWSLGVEEQFYVVWPLLLLVIAWLLRRRPALAVRVIGVVAVVIVAVSLTYCIYATEHNATAAYFSPFTRAWELAVGAALALAANRISQLPRVVGAVLAWGGLAGIVVSALVYTDATAYPGSAAMLPVFATAAVVAGGCVGATSAERVLGLRPMQAIGGWSYSIYLWHWPALILVQGYVGKTLSTWQNLIIVVGASMIAYTAFSLLETPVRRAGTLIREPSAALAMSLALILLSLGVTSAFINRQKVDVALAVAAGRGAQLSSSSAVVGTSQILAEVAQAGSITTATPSTLALAATAAGDAESLAEEGCEAQDAQTTVGACVYGDPAGTKTMVLYGDSHAGMWEPSFDALAKRVHYKLVVLSKSGCPVADLDYYDFQSDTANRNCTTWQKYAIARINALHPELVVLTSAFYTTENADKSLTTPAQWEAGLTRTLDSITVAPAARVVLGDQAYLAGDDGGCIQQHRADVQACALSRDQAVPAAKVAATRGAATAAGARYVDPLPWLCSSTVCYPVVNGFVVYRNQFHLTATYATYLSGALGESLGLEKVR